MAGVAQLGGPVGRHAPLGTLGFERHQRGLAPQGELDARLLQALFNGGRGGWVDGRGGVERHGQERLTLSWRSRPDPAAPTATAARN